MSKSFMQKKNYTKLIQVLFSNKKVILLIGVIYTLIKSEKMFELNEMKMMQNNG